MTGTAPAFYGVDLATVHDSGFGVFAAAASRVLLGRLSAYGLSSGTVVDLGCGSGIVAAAVAEQGYKVVGVDISPAMVALARERAPAARFTVGSVHDFDLPPCIAVTAVGEILNYAADPRAGIDQIASLARRVRRVLDRSGAFMFDVATPGRAGSAGRYELERSGSGWEMHTTVTERAEPPTLTREITVRRTVGSVVQESTEHHTLRLYDPDAVVDVLTEAGFALERLRGYGPTTLPLGWHAFAARPA